ncbi:Rid family detoxifying hydrolase [Paraburkholderia sp. BL21I4N1]|uniref:Rid family detoxifying hydrolase n=1 Tax=Paraburkholderia sp. BL21I4N1 TaxID=1938801 RepID=UPI000CFBA3E2|nr:Rid family detoxifying hydrolase [Paraburkholderia sp. BL21I4N1]PQV43543.1 2-iminobutanoate/2-iminopropanoate deaminase [Paraburkholderia sp. BL21I4N1]
MNSIYEVASPDAPQAIGPYSQAVKCGNLLFVSGQLPLDPVSGAITSEDPTEQLVQCLKNIDAIARSAGASIRRTVKTTIFLTDLSTFPLLNERYAEFFSKPFPARACVEISALPKSAKVEIEAVIALD